MSVVAVSWPPGLQPRTRPSLSRFLRRSPLRRRCLLHAAHPPRLERRFLETSDPHPSKWLDLEMLMTPGGREHARPEWEELFTKAGFEIARIVPLKAAESLIEVHMQG